jgi:hypothetical protein
LLYTQTHELLHRLWRRWFHLTAEQFDAINFAGIMLYKVGVLLFNLVPTLVLSLAG